MRRQKTLSPLAVVIAALLFFTGCATQTPYIGTNPQNPQFERGMPFPPLDFLGDMLSKLPQLMLWNIRFGNHRISSETEQAVADFLSHYEVSDVKVRLNQWAPHKELGRLFTNPHIGWPYKILFFPSTLITSLLARPFSGLLISDYYDPGTNSIHIFSDDAAIALHESGHAWDFSKQEYKGTYAFIRSVPGVDLFQENMATDETLYYLEETGQYERLLKAYKVLYPAYATYIGAYISASPIATVGALLFGHWYGRFTAKEKEWQLRTQGKWPEPGPSNRDLAE
ncbi:MAG: hypothetical protein ACOY3K_02820 [Candidatus Omnitrophota bacterium]